jgi:hypothetical protein
MKEEHLTKDNFLTKTNYFNHYSLNLLIGSLFLTLPTFSVMLLIILWENFDFVWVPPLLGILGWFLVIPSTYTLSRLSKERIAVDALSLGFMAMLCLCSALIPIKYASLMHLLKPQPSGIAGQSSVSFDLKEAEETYLEQIRLHGQEIETEENE